MADITFVDIPVVPKQWTKDVSDTVSLKYKSQDIIYASMGLRYPFQRKRKQFTRGLLTLSSYLKNKGHTTSYFNYKDENLESHIKNLSSESFVGIPSITAFMDEISEISSKIKKWNPDVSLVLGGYHATARIKQTFEEIPSIDIIITGEGELPLEKLLAERKKAQGIFFRGENDTFLLKKTQFLDLKQIPNPDYSLLPGNLNEYNFNIQTARGCSYRCVFCVNGYFWKQERPSPIEMVENELLFLANNLDSNTFIHFSDNDFLHDEKRAVIILDYIKQLGSPFNLSCDVRADSVTPDLIKLMNDAGFKRIYLGIEETDEQILAATKKGLTANQSINSAKIIRENGSGIIIEAYWMNGLPGSTKESLIKSKEAAEYLLDNEIIDLISGSTVFTPLPGTPIFEMPNKYNMFIDNKEWGYYLRDNFYPPFHYNNLSVQQLHDSFLSFENMLLEKYKKKLNMTSEQIIDTHRKLFGDLYSLNKKE